MKHLIPKDVPKCDACPLVKAINQTSKIRELIAGEKLTDFSTFTHTQLVEAASELEMKYKSLLKMNDQMHRSNKALHRIIDSGTVYVGGKPVDLGNNDKDKHVTPDKPSQDLQELERIAFDPKSADKEAKKALRQLLKISKNK